MPHKTVRILLVGELLISCHNQLDQPKVILEQGSWYLFQILPSKCTPHKIRHCLTASAHLCPLVPTWPEVCSADARTMPLPVRGFPTQQLSPMYRLLLYCRAQSFKGHKPMEKGISQNQHIGSQNTNSKNNLPFVCLSVYWPKNKLQSRKLLLCTNYNELTLHGKIHKTTDKLESNCYLTHVTKTKEQPGSEICEPAVN